ncbi:MAG: hypothetical protein ABSA84_03510 [Gammaproteobacteria bacterium]|jgi:hypothetical protein
MNTKNSLITVVILVFFITVDLAYAKGQQQVDPTMPKNFRNSPNENDRNIGNVESEQGGNLVLTAILINPNNSSAIINNKIVREKDQIARYEVIKIESNKVILKKIVSEAELEPEKAIEIKLPAISIKK